VLLSIGAIVLSTLCLPAAEPSAEQLEFFEKRIRPVFVENCYSCHSSKLKTPLGGLRVDSREELLKGGNSGPALVPGNPEESRIAQAVTHQGTLKMPPNGKLDQQQIQDIATWVKMGAPYPAASDSASNSAGEPQFWAFQPVKDPPEPQVTDTAWIESPIDRFILAALESKDLTPAPPAEKRTLLRRATYDLTGLPPSPEEIRDFIEDTSPQAFEKVVDRLLASPHYGERWGRHWLDLVRYAETNGHEFDNDKLDPWKYRDYVIRAFNQDLPYNRFVREHIAGDLLESKRLSSDGAYRESPLGTSFFWFGEVLNSATDSVKSRADEVDNQIDVMSKAFLGLTVACARCHDHKFDPIPTSDYYALAGVLHSTGIREAVLDSPERVREIASLSAEIREINRRIDQIKGAEPAPASAVDYRMEDTVFENFNKSQFGKWTPSGQAFADGPQGGAANSLAAGSERFVGSLTSTQFQMPKLYLHVRISGTKSDPKLKERGNLRFTLVADGYKGQHIMPKGGKPEWKTVRMTLERGRMCYFEI
ncbi:MAG: DUF1549 domain-containing protein, partial [Bryobacteraceae bacterium]